MSRHSVRPATAVAQFLAGLWWAGVLPVHGQIQNIQSNASAVHGGLISIGTYTVPADGILAVQGGAAGGSSPTPLSVRFGGTDMIPAASLTRPDFWWPISASLHWHPVKAGESGAIVIDYGGGANGWSTSRRGIVALTLAGLDTLHAVQVWSDGDSTNMGRTGPDSAYHALNTTRNSIILSAFTSNGPGESSLLGTGNTLNAYPTVPITDFHSTRVYSGHATAGPGAHALGYKNVDDMWFDYILILAAFASAGQGTGVEKRIDSAHDLEISVTPNPFHAGTVIRLGGRLKQGANRCRIFDARGALVKDLTPEMSRSGGSTVRWSAPDFAPGLYLLRMETPLRVLVKPLLLMP